MLPFSAIKNFEVEVYSAFILDKKRVFCFSLQENVVSLFWHLKFKIKTDVIFDKIGTSVSLQNQNFDERQLSVNYCGFAAIVLRF